MSAFFFISNVFSELEIGDPKFGVRGFEFDNSTSEIDCVLVIGLNLAGNEEAAKMRKLTRHICIV